MTVAERLRRNRKITITTRQTVSTRVNSTSSIELRIGFRSVERDVQLHGRRNLLAEFRQQPRMPSTTSTVLVPGCFWMARIMPRTAVVPGHQLVVLDAVDHVGRAVPAAPANAVALGHDDRPVGGGVGERARSIRW